VMDFLRDNRFVVSGKSFLPFSAEMHYWRVPKDKWIRCLEAIRDARLAVVSTYVPWNLHEYEEGRFDFDGSSDEQADLVGFLELCRKLDMHVILRPGPWICAEWPNGGYPDYLFNHPDMLALDSTGRTVEAGNSVRLRNDHVISYSNQRFLDFVERYYRALVDDVRDWMYPDGPVFLIQLDNETSWCFRGDAYTTDYNSQIIKKEYPRFLEEKHGRIARLNEVYGGATYQSFDQVGPPRQYSATAPQDLVQYFDWADFKEQQLLDYHSALRDMLEQSGVETGFYTNIPGGANYAVPSNWSKADQTCGLVALDWYWPELYNEASRYFRYLRTCSETVLAAELMAGMWAEEPDRQRIEKPIPPEMQLYCILACLSVGMKGANYHMFVERDHWYGSPVTEDGEKTSVYEIFKRVNEIAEEIELPTLSTVENVSLGVYRPYLWYNYVEADQPFDYINRLTQDITPRLATTLEQMGYEYSIVDPRVGDSLVKNPILLFGSAEFMDSDTQLRLARYVAKGGILIMYGLPPHLDQWMKSCTTFCGAVGLDAHRDEGPARVEAATGTFSVYRFGYIEGADWQPLWEENGRMVAGRCQIGAGIVHVFAAAPVGGGQPELSFFLGQLLGQYDALSAVRTNISHIRASLHRNASNMVLYVVNTVNADRHHGQKYWYPIVQFDPRSSGLADATYIMEDLLTGERRSVRGLELVRGVELPVPTRWGARMFRITQDQGRGASSAAPPTAE